MNLIKTLVVVSGLGLLFSLISPTLTQAQLGIGRQTKVEQTVSYERPTKYVVADIKVEGAQYLSPASLISMTGIQIGDTITVPGEEIAQAIKRLWKQGLMGNIELNAEKIEGDKIYLVLLLTERPRLSKIEFEGVTKSQSNTLAEKIKLIRGKIVNDVVLKNTENTIRQYYVEKGFKNCSVKLGQRPDTLMHNGIQLLVSVDKGDKVRIEDIAFEGVESLPEKKLLRKMKKTKEKGPLMWLFPSKFIVKEYRNDKNNIIEYYNKNGYRDATIVSDSVYDVDSETVNILLRISEGKKYYYRDIVWEGNYVYKEDFLDKVLGIQKGDVYNPDDLQKRLNFNPNGSDITSLYMDDGYLFFSVNPVEVAVGEDSIDLHMRIYEGEQATINKIILTGNTRTSDHVVLREIRSLPGQKFSRSDLIRTQRELATIGYFDPEQIGMNFDPNMSDGTVDIHYSVVEKPSDQIELSGGWGGAFGFVGTLGLVFNNFSAQKLFDTKAWKNFRLPQGDGQKLALRMQANGRRYQTYTFTFSEPWLGGKRPNNFSINLQHSIQRRIDLYGNSSGSLKVSGATVGLGRQLKFPDDFFTLSNSVSYLRYKLTDYPNLFRDLSSGIFNNVVFNTTISRSNVDSPIFPRSGANMTLSINLTPPYSKFRDPNHKFASDAERFKFVEYHKWMFDNWWYVQIAGNLVLSARAHMGFIGTYGKNQSISPFERFIVGGDGLSFGNFLLGTDIVGLRGYANQSIRPSDRYNEGGTVFNKYVMELRYPLSLNPAATVYLLAFSEAGNNWGSIKEFNPFDLKRSVGLGARIFLPAFGLLGFDYGYGFDPVPGNSKANGGQFHFTIGQMIR